MAGIQDRAEIVKVQGAELALNDAFIPRQLSNMGFSNNLPLLLRTVSDALVSDYDSNFVGTKVVITPDRDFPKAIIEDQYQRNPDIQITLETRRHPSFRTAPSMSKLEIQGRTSRVTYLSLEDTRSFIDKVYAQSAAATLKFNPLSMGVSLKDPLHIFEEDLSVMTDDDIAALPRKEYLIDVEHQTEPFLRLGTSLLNNGLTGFSVRGITYTGLTTDIERVLALLPEIIERRY